MTGGPADDSGRTPGARFGAFTRWPLSPLGGRRPNSASAVPRNCRLRLSRDRGRRRLGLVQGMGHAAQDSATGGKRHQAETTPVPDALRALRSANRAGLLDRAATGRSPAHRPVVLRHWITRKAGGGRRRHPALLRDRAGAQSVGSASRRGEQPPPRAPATRASTGGSRRSDPRAPRSPHRGR